ncbi:MAG: MutS family DNA mismatch repair protein [Bacteroidia bacterium]
MPASPAETYHTLLDRYQRDHATAARRYNGLSYARLLVFLGGAGLTYLVFRLDALAGILVGGLALLGFLYLLRAHAAVAARRDLLGRLAGIAADEGKALAGDWTHFDDGADFIDPLHPFSYDLDLYGRGTLFQYLNRSTTPGGRTRLARSLDAPSRDTAAIRARQAAIAEVAGDIAWSLDFQAQARGHAYHPGELPDLLAWVREPGRLKAHHRHLVRVLPVLFGLAVALWLLPDLPLLRTALGGWHLPGWAPLGLFLLNLNLVGLHLRDTAREQAQVGRKSRALEIYAVLLDSFARQPWQAPLLRQWRDRLQQPDATGAIRHLAQLSYLLDQRLNIFAGLFLNGAMLWDLRYRLRLEAWRSCHAGDLADWFEVLAEVDALQSLARYAHNHPTHPMPELLDGPFRLDARDMGHPLIPAGQRVGNDLHIGAPGEFFIITGANMAGKSTFLRTTGVNLLLAMAGAPVCARAMALTPTDLITSIRASDSLYNHESYFYAELKQLKAIIDRLAGGETVFVIVDEMLRGTNSHDKQLGSRRFIEQLIRLRGVGLIATHDLSLGSLADAYPGQAMPVCFEVAIEGESLRFDYKLRPGISQNLNATFLMQQMGIMPRD